MSAFTDSVFSDDTNNTSNRNNGFSGFNGFSNNTARAARNNNVSSSVMWFVSLLPLFAIFLENYAINAIAGIILWSTVIVLIPFFCIIDCKKLEAEGYDMTTAKKWLALPPVYVFKRELIFHHDPNKGLIMGLGLITAIFLNGFSQGLSLTPERVQTVVQNTTVSNLDNFTGTSNNVISDQLEDYFGKSLKWDSKKTKEGFSVIASGTKNGENMEVYIKVSHDGFCYQGVKVDKITINGEKVSKQNGKKLLQEIFIPETLKDTAKDSKKSSQKTQNV